MILSIVAAVGEENAIGKDNTLPWRLPGDLRYFKKLTEGNTIIMGRKTFESLPGLLPNRRHIVITRNNSYCHSGIETASSLENAIAKASQNKEIFVIGGGSIYSQALPLCHRLYITEVCARIEADVFFPEFDRNRYELREQSEFFTENGISYRFLHYRLKDERV